MHVPVIVRWRVLVVLAVVGIASGTARAQTSVIGVDAPAGETDPRSSRTPLWLRAMWGTTPESGVSYLPIGLHSDSVKAEGFHLTGLSYRSVFGGTFMNSFGDRTWAVGLERTVVNSGRLHINYWFGAMAGYDGRLVGSRGIPFSHSFLFRYNVNPCLGVPVLIDLRRHVQFEVFLNPIASIVGFRVPFGRPAQTTVTAHTPPAVDNSSAGR